MPLLDDLGHPLDDPFDVLGRLQHTLAILDLKLHQQGLSHGLSDGSLELSLSEFERFLLSGQCL